MRPRILMNGCCIGEEGRSQNSVVRMKESEN